MNITFHCDHCGNDFEIPIPSANNAEIMALIIECVTAKCPQCGRQCKAQVPEQ